MSRLLPLLWCVVSLPAAAATLAEPLVFTGTCDASAALTLGNDLFVVANDEDDVLRFYKVSQPGNPVQKFDLRSLFPSTRKKSESDIEGAARIGDHCFFITSHGRDAAGKPAPNRHRLFALEMNLRDGQVSVRRVGNIYTNLVETLAAQPQYARFKLAEAAQLTPKAAGGLNIEALTDTPEGRLLIGFRSPIPEGRALIAPLVNPDQVLLGSAPEFDAPILLDLGGLGLRGMGSSGHDYNLIAGPIDGNGTCRTFTWDGGEAPPRAVRGLEFSGINPEGICFHDSAGRSDFVILSDDGTRKIRGKDCKDLPESQREFRVYRLFP